MSSKDHFIQSITFRDNVYILECYTTIENFDHIEEIHVVGECVSICQVSKINEKNNTAYYQVDIPSTIISENSFYVVQIDGKKKRVWKPSNDLEISNIPEGFYFNNRYLNLTYNSNISSVEKYYDRFSAVIEPVLTSIAYKENHLVLEGCLFIPIHLLLKQNDVSLHVVKFRDEDVSITFPITIKPIEDATPLFTGIEKKLHKKLWQKEALFFECSIELKRLMLQSGYYNLHVKYSNQMVTIKNYYKRLEKKEDRYLMNLSLLKKTIVVPYIDDVVNIWRLDVYNLSVFEWIMLRILLKRIEFKKYLRDSRFWLIGEYNDTARDNGLHFFKYVRKNHPKVKIYYVIHKDSPDRKKINDPQVIEYGSFKHFKVAAKAKLLIFTHYPNYLLPKINAITDYRGNYQKYHKVFIQHGVIATTASVSRYRKRLRKFQKFVVSSTFERDNICKYLGYDEKEVVISGLARWDKLLSISKRTSNILIMPTWRNDLANASTIDFQRSEFYTFWNSLLWDEDFLSSIKNNNINVTFSLHIGLERFGKCFKFPPQVTLANGENIQKLLANCGLLVTDYSSVAFDVLLQHKPVIFCPFDYSEMIKLRGEQNFIDYQKDLPGPICYTVAEAIGEIRKSIETNYTISEKYKDRRNKFYDYTDQKNCERIYNSIMDLIQ